MDEIDENGRFSVRVRGCVGGCRYYAEEDEGEGQEGVFVQAVTGGEVEVVCWLFYY